MTLLDIVTMRGMTDVNFNGFQYLRCLNILFVGDRIGSPEFEIIHGIKQQVALGFLHFFVEEERWIIFQDAREIEDFKNQCKEKLKKIEEQQQR